jgi:hypothetical protein
MLRMLGELKNSKPDYNAVNTNFVELNPSQEVAICAASSLCNKLIFYCEELCSPMPKLEDHPCRLSVTAYSIYSQLPSIP